jgi:hypothetical protein
VPVKCGRYTFTREDIGPQNTLHLTALNSPAEEGLTAYAVSPRVNNARNDDVDFAANKSP